MGGVNVVSRTPIASLVLLERAFDMLDYAVLLVDGEGRIEFRNHRAAELMRKPDCPLESVNGALAARARGSRTELKHAIGAACAGGGAHGMRLERPGIAHERWLRIIVTPLHSAELAGCAAVWIVNGPSAGLPGERMLSVLFGLSPAEARLARSLLMGRTPEEHARHASVRIATVRTQLHSIYSKTATRRQAELVALLARVPALQLAEA